MKPTKRICLFLLAGVSSLTGCSGPRGAEKQIGNYIEKNCAGRSACVVNLRGATPFEWDKVYVFKYTAKQAEIEQATGAKITGYHELRRYFIFTKAGAVVHSEDEPTNVEHPIKGEVVFAMPDSASYQGYGIDTSFTVSQESSEAGPYYLLQPNK